MSDGPSLTSAYVRDIQHSYSELELRPYRGGFSRNPLSLLLRNRRVVASVDGR